MSNDTKIHGTSIMNATATGNKFSQQNSINWSYLSLGSVALYQTNMKQNTHVFKPSTIDCKLMNESLTNNSGML